MKTTIIFTSSLYGIRFFESQVELDDGMVKRIQVNIKTLVRKGVIGNANGYRKAETWLNTPEGQKYVATLINRPKGNDPTESAQAGSAPELLERSETT